jgi:hypothetical protein
VLQIETEIDVPLNRACGPVARRPIADPIEIDNVAPRRLIGVPVSARKSSNWLARASWRVAVY